MHFYVLEASRLGQFTELVGSLVTEDGGETEAAALPPWVELISMDELSGYAQSFFAIAGGKVKWPRKAVKPLDEISDGAAFWVPFFGPDAERYAQSLANFTVTQKLASEFLGEENLESDTAWLNELRDRLSAAIAKLSPVQVGLLRVPL